MVAAANAGKALAEMAKVVPNSGGITAWFAGENSVANFGAEIASLGRDLKSFSDNVRGINPQNVTAAANAGKALAEMASVVPNEGGVVAWFTGDNSLAKFGDDIANFGPCIKKFSDNVKGINGENVTAAANAGKALAEMASVVPNEGGVVAWFTGENSLIKFGTEIAIFGLDLKAFSDNIKGINGESVTAAANAGKTLAEMTQSVPSENGIAQWFSGEKSLAKFGPEIAIFGLDLKAFSVNVDGINTANVTAAANAGKTLAELTDTIPNEGGIEQWFGGQKSLASFGSNVASFGKDIKSFSDNVEGINTANVTAAAEAGKALAELTDTVPNTGGIESWFGGEKSLAHFGDNVASFGASMKSFSDNVANIAPKNVTAAAEAGKALVELTNTVPDEGGIKAWFCGEKSLSKFGEDIAGFGTCIADFSDNVADIVPDNITAASKAGESLVELINTIPKDVNITAFKNDLATFKDSMTDFQKSLENVDISYSIEQANLLVDMVQDMNGADFTGLNSLAESLKDVSENGVTNFVNSFTNAESRAETAITNLVNGTLSVIKNLKPDFYDAGSTVIISFISGMNFKTTKVQECFNGLVAMFVTTIDDSKSKFENSGASLVVHAIMGINSKMTEAKNTGGTFISEFSSGISDNLNKVDEAAKLMAQTAVNSIRKELGINSPSKELYSVGEYTGMGFVNALNDYSRKSFEAGENMADSAKGGIAEIVSDISNLINGDIECNPTIRPVLDLSDVENGAAGINNLFTAQKSADLAVAANREINSSFEIQQNAASNGDVVQSISDLRGDVASLRDVVGNLKVVMDGRTLVGSIVEEMDNALGKRIISSRRR